jgi:hypothetical protein
MGYSTVDFGRCYLFIVSFDALKQFLKLTDEKSWQEISNSGYKKQKCSGSMAVR